MVEFHDQESKCYTYCFLSLKKTHWNVCLSSPYKIQDITFLSLERALLILVYLILIFLKCITVTWNYGVQHILIFSLFLWRTLKWCQWESPKCLSQILYFKMVNQSLDKKTNIDKNDEKLTNFLTISNFRYCSLLEQYLSSSYGDHNFANVLLMPLQLQFDKKYRRAVWTEYCEVLRMFPLPLKQVSCDIIN